MTIGLDVLYHLKTTIDSRYGVVTLQNSQAEEADADRANADDGGVDDAGVDVGGADVGRADQRWEIPLFNFSTASLAEARFDDQPARLLIDTGNAVGTFVSGRWADGALSGGHGRKPPPTLWLRKRKLDLPPFEMAGQTIEHWPVVDSLPRELEQLDTVDLVMGRDLLHGYRTTIDLANRRLILSGGPLPPRPAAPARRITAGAESTPLP
jgi:hypothetical protein